MAKKVGQKENTEETPKKKKKGKTIFNINDAVAVLPVLDAEGKPTKDTSIQSAVNADGKLIAVPVGIAGTNDGDPAVQIGFNPDKNKPLTKSDYADTATFLDHQAYLAELRAEKYTALAAERRAKATNMRKFGDEATRKKADRLTRMRKQMAELEKQLAEEGVVID